MSIEQIGALLWQATLETLLMTVPATIISYLIGMPLGVLLVISRPQGIKPMPRLNTILGTVINFLRSIPFIILVALLFPVTRIAMGSAIGTVPFIFPLVISAFPYVARMIEGSLNEVDAGVIEAAQSMGSTTWQLIVKVMIPEAMPSLLNGAAIVTVTVLGYSAMSSAAAGGGLGATAITDGLYRRKMDIMYSASIALVILVQIITFIGKGATNKIDHRKR